jgi:hypothetical protein
MLIKFVQLVERETRYQAEKLDLIRSGKHRELHRDEIWVPLEYYDFKVIMDKKEKEETSKLTKKTRKEKKRKEKMG